LNKLFDMLCGELSGELGGTLSAPEFAVCTWQFAVAERFLHSVSLRSE
jgi:hypothetical protein